MRLETENGLDNEDRGKTPNLGAPVLLSPNVLNSLSGQPIYLSPDLEDIIDQQNYDVYHEEVHGTILMPRIKFGLDSDEECIRGEEDYQDYANIVPNIKTRNYLERRPGSVKRAGIWNNQYRQQRIPGTDPKAPVRIYPNPNYSPTIEEMIPYAKIRDSKDTFIVMADDPVREFYFMF